jgi:FkbM family methyltransferase
MKTKKQILENIGNSYVPYVDSFKLHGINYGRSLFDIEWIKYIIGNPKVIFDIGCYDGGDSIRFKQAFSDCEVYSFEASPVRLQMLNDKDKQYGINIIDKAVCDYNGTINFYESIIYNDRVDAQGSIFKHTDAYKSKYPFVSQNNHSVEVTCITVETFCAENNITEIDFAHIDVEGAEINVIKGFGTILPKIVFIETLGDEMFQGGTKKDDVHNLLISYGYFLAKDLGTDRLYVLENILQTIETFITVHDQEIILNYEKDGKFSNLSKYRYVFVGNNDSSKIKDLDNVIIAKNYSDNIEHMNYFVDYTSWYLLIKNKLIETNLVSLIQYDVDITESFESETLRMLENNSNAIVGYVPYEIKSDNFISSHMSAEPLNRSLINVYNKNIYNIVDEHVKKTSDTLWPSANNIATSKTILEMLINWFEPIAYDMGNHKHSGHSFERSIKIFSIIYNINNNYTDFVLKHYQLDSHKTQRS